MSYDFKKTIGGQLVEQYRQELMKVIEVPNHMLPEEYRNEKTGLRSLAELDTMHVKEHGPTQHQIDKAAKAQRIENYRQQWENNEAIEYDVDDDRQYRIEVAFVKGAVDNGWVEIDEDEV
jgi:hypothetical protein